MVKKRIGEVVEIDGEKWEVVDFRESRTGDFYFLDSPSKGSEEGEKVWVVRAFVEKERVYPGYGELEGKEWVKTGEFRLARKGEVFLSTIDKKDEGAYLAPWDFGKVKSWILTQLFRDTVSNGWVLTGEERFLEKGDYWLEPYMKGVSGPSAKVGGLVRKIVKRWPSSLTSNTPIPPTSKTPISWSYKRQKYWRERALKAEQWLAVGRECFKEKLATIEKLIEQVQVNSDRARGQERQNEVLLEDVIKIVKEGLNAE